MNADVERNPQAILDLVEQTAYIGQHNPYAAERFLGAAERTFRQLARTPRIGRRCQVSNPNLAGLRSWPIRGFENYLVFYLERDFGIQIIRVLHGARDIDEILEEQ